MKLQTIVGLLDLRLPLAQRGHKDMARRVAGYIAFLLDQGAELPPAARAYLIDGLREIAGGASGSDAFHTTGKKGVRDFSEHAAEKYSTQIAPALYMQELIDDGEAANPHAASLIAADVFGIDASALRKYHRRIFSKD